MTKFLTSSWWKWVHAGYFLKYNSWNHYLNIEIFITVWQCFLLLKFLTDMLFLEGIDAFARVMGKDSKNPVFYYYFTHEGNITLVPGEEDKSGVPGE